MKLKYKFKNGMILGEVIFAFFLCGILLAISIYMFKSNDVSKTPYIYSVLKNLPNINKVIMQECYEEGFCSNYTELPDNVNEYCERLANNLVTTGAVNCSTGGDASISAYGKGQNLRLANGSSFYGLSPRDGWDIVRFNGRDINYYLDVYIDINGANNGDNVLGTDIFPIRIFKNGAVVPSVDFYNNFDAREDDEFFAYRVVLNKAQDENNKNTRVIQVLDARNQQEINDELPFREKVSYKEAICVSNPSLYPRYFQGEDCNNYTILGACNFDKPSAEDILNYPHLSDKSAYCSIEPVKPRGSGIFKIFGI